MCGQFGHFKTKSLSCRLKYLVKPKPQNDKNQQISEPFFKMGWWEKTNYLNVELLKSLLGL